MYISIYKLQSAILNNECKLTIDIVKNKIILQF